MPQPTKPSIQKSSNSFSGLRRFVPAFSNTRRQKVFFDSPGLLEQSQHWGGLVIWTIAAGTSAALLWAFLGRVDQTVNATGRLEPSSGQITVTSPSGGIVSQIFVSDGEKVLQGNPLVVIESKGTQARLSATSKQLAFYRYENTLYNLLLDKLDSYNLSSLPEPPELIRDEDRTRSVQLTVQETSAKLLQLKTRLASQAKTLALKQELVDSLRPVYEGGGLAKYNYLSSVDELQQLESQIIETEQQITAVIAQAGRQVTSNDRQILSLQAELTALQERSVNLTLKAQQSGTIFNLSVGSGSVIGNGTKVMEIIPDGGLKAKVFLPNSELGFVRSGMPVKLAVSSFPAGEYGYLKGVITRIGADALDDSDKLASNPRRANTFPMSIALEPNTDKKSILDRLAPGMQVSANIIVRQRPVITLLTDVFTKGSESLQNSR